jgi:hypothetical protein
MLRVRYALSSLDDCRTIMTRKAQVAQLGVNQLSSSSEVCTVAGIKSIGS